MSDATTLTPSPSPGGRGELVSGWIVDGQGGVRTPAGMLVFRLTKAGDLEILDRKLNRLVTLTALELLRMRAEWMSRG